MNNMIGYNYSCTFVIDVHGLQKRTFYTTQESGSIGSWLSVAKMYLCFDVFNFTLHLTTDTQLFRFPGVFKALKKFVSFSLPWPRSSRGSRLFQGPPKSHSWSKTAPPKWRTFDTIRLKLTSSCWKNRWTRIFGIHDILLVSEAAEFWYELWPFM